MFEVMVDKRVERDLTGIPGHVKDCLLELIAHLRIDPYRKRPGVDIRKLRGRRDSYRLRIGDYRILYSVDKTDRIVRVTTVVPRKTAYRVFETNGQEEP